LSYIAQAFLQRGFGASRTLSSLHGNRATPPPGVQPPRHCM